MSSLKTSDLSTNKFKVGDEVEVVSLTNTDNVHGVVEEMLNVGDRAFVDGCDGYTVFLKDDCFSYHIQDFKLIKSVDEINASQNESIDQFFELNVILPKNDEDDFTCCLGKGIESKPYNPLVAQEGGGHYKNRGIQPIEYSHANNLSASQHSVVKYITRYYNKGGIEDLSKIVHFVLLEAYFRYGEQGSTELKDKILTILGENKES